METSAVRAQLLALLGFPPGSHPSEAAIEDSRNRLCGMLQLSSGSTDEMIIDVANRMGYQPGSSSDEVSSKAKPAADASELANIKAKRTTSGLSSLSSTKNTQSGIRPLHSRSAAANPSGDHTTVEGDEAAQQDLAAQQLAADKRNQAQALRTSAQFRAVEKQSLWQKIAGVFKKDSE